MKIQTPLPASKKNVPAMLADTDLLFKQAKLGSETFCGAEPFPHLLLPGMIKAPCCVALCEGLRQWSAASPKGHFYPQPNLPSVVHLLLWELSSSTLIRHFSAMTGMPPLLPDPFLLRAGPSQWREPVVKHMAQEEFYSRHPKTDLQNVIRLEIFVADDPQATFSLELTGGNKRNTSYSVVTGSAFLTSSDRYEITVRSDIPEKWCSLLSYYYVNDRARVLRGEEQPRAY